MNNSQQAAPAPCCLYCGRPLGALPQSAPHKKFCNSKHRMDYHAAELKALRAELQQKKETGASQP